MLNVGSLLLTFSHSGNDFCLSPDDVIHINRDLIGNPFNLLDRGRLESALASPLQTFGGEFLIPSVLGRAGNLLHGVVNAHAFYDGNKRTGWLCAVTYLESEGFVLGEIPDFEIVDLVEGVANIEIKFTYQDVARWFASRLA